MHLPTLLLVLALTPIAERLGQEATALATFAESPLARELLTAARHLPAAPARTLLRDPTDRRYYTSVEAAALSEEQRATLETVELEAERFYTTKYGSPLAYVRPIDLVGRLGLESFRGSRVLDFGYGTIGHLRLMAHAGADATGVDVDSFLAALYSEDKDQGQFGAGTVQLVHGFWSGDDATRAAVGSGYDLFLTKNTLKLGYIHPAREAAPERLIQLGVTDERFLRELHRVLNPGGLAVIYNLHPAQAPDDEPYRPWADGRFPFSRALTAQVGFEILAFDVDDSEAARRLGALLGWAETGMDLEKNLFGTYTILRRP